MSKECPACHGTGYILEDCPYCRNTDSFEFENLSSVTCKNCNGKGYHEDTCPICNGSGFAENEEYAS